MAVFAATNTFVSGTSITASGHNTNWSDVTTWLNNRYNVVDTWSNVKISSTDTNPFDVTSSGASTEVSINNTATDGDPVITFKLSGTQLYVFGVDDSASDAFKFGTTSLTTNIAFQIPSTGAQVQFNAGTEAVPSVCFTGFVDDGFYFVSDGNIGFSSGGTKSLQFNSGGILVPNGNAGGPSYSFINDTNTGIYGNGSDALIISLGGTAYFTFTTNLLSPTGAGSISIGDASNYLNDVSYKTLTDRGCLGWFDEGVELQDGRIVSDCEAIAEIKKHPTKKTIYGIDMLDYKTFPRVVYKKATVDGVELPRDNQDEPIGGSDGVEMTAMQSIMIGSLKELHSRVSKLEKK